MSISIDEIEERLRTGIPGRPVRHIVIAPPPTKREVRYVVAGAFAALIAGVLLAGVL